MDAEDTFNIRTEQAPGANKGMRRARAIVGCPGVCRLVYERRKSVPVGYHKHSFI